MSRLSAVGIGHDFGAAAVLDAVDLSLEAGRVTVLMGPNGAGKSTLMRALAGLIRPRRGQTQLDGVDIATIDRRKVARQIAVVLEAPETTFAWTTLELVLMGRAPYLALGRFEGDDDVQRARTALARVDAERFAQRVFTTLSAGERQRVLIARALCQDTPVLLLDEPTSHLDPAHALRISALLRALAAAGKTVGCVLHDLNLAALCADHLVMLAGGRVVAQGAPDDVLTTETVRAVYGVEGRPRPPLKDNERPGFILERLSDDGDE